MQAILARMAFILFLVAQISLNATAQSKVIKTYVGPPMPVMGEQAITQAIDQPGQVAPDGAGGFYVASFTQHRVYRVAASGVLSLIAGAGIAGFSGDGGPAVLAKLYAPSGLVLDSAGNLYIADTYNYRIRKVTAAGIISTIAGNGVQGRAGDEGAAINAELSGPKSIAIDNAGSLLIADSNCMIRKVTSDGIMHRAAGTGTCGFSGDGGPATSAMLYSGYGVAVDNAGKIFVADYFNHRIRMITPDGIIQTIAGNGTASYNGDGGAATAATLRYPSGVALDSAGNIYIADSLNNRIRLVAPNGTISTVAGNGNSVFGGDGGFATSSQLAVPSDVACDSAGNVYISESKNRVRRFMVGGSINTVAGNGTTGFRGDGVAATQAMLDHPTGLTVDSAGNLYIADNNNYRIRMVALNGIITTIAGNGLIAPPRDGNATSLSLYDPFDVASDPGGNIYIAQYGYNQIRKLSPTGSIATIAGSNSGFGGDGGPATSAKFYGPRSVALDSASNIYIADENNQRVRKITPDGVISTIAGNGTAGFGGDGGPAISANLNRPSSVAIDSAGNLYISDFGNYRIRKVTPDGIISTIAGNGTSNFLGDGIPASAAQICPNGLALDSNDNLYFADCNHRIRKITPNGIIRTIAGNGAAGFGGDEGWAVNAELNLPYDVALDSEGNIYIAELYNNRVRILFSVAPIVNTAGISSITRTTAAGGGAVLLDGGDDVTARGVCWSTSANPTVADTCTSNGAGTGTFSSSITGLIPRTSYYVRAYATNVVGTSYGADSMFTTLDLPAVTTAELSSIRSTSASGGGNVVSDGGAPVTARGICWSVSAGPTIANACTIDGSGMGTFSSSITGLSAGTGYHVRAYATNSAGTAYGADRTFTTLDLPAVTTTELTSRRLVSANGGGNVTSDGGASVTGRGVCWSALANHTISNACTTDGAGTGIFSSSITGLIPGTSYHVRAYATNSVGTAYGADIAFATTDFQLGAASGGSLDVTIKAGSSAMYNIMVIGVNGLSESVTFACDSGLPQAADCSIGPNPLTVNGSAAAPFSVIINTTSRTTAAGFMDNLANMPWERSAPVLVTCLSGLILAIFMKKRWRTPIALVLLFSIIQAGCGNMGISRGTPAGKYAIVISAKSGDISRAITLNLTVK